MIVQRKKYTPIIFSENGYSKAERCPNRHSRLPFADNLIPNFKGKVTGKKFLKRFL